GRAVPAGPGEAGAAGDRGVGDGVPGGGGGAGVRADGEAWVGDTEPGEGEPGGAADAAGGGGEAAGDGGRGAAAEDGPGQAGAGGPAHVHQRGAELPAEAVQGRRIPAGLEGGRVRRVRGHGLAAGVGGPAELPL